MTFNEGIEKLQKKYPEYIILVRNGIFYNAVGKDAIFIEEELNLVKTCFGKNKCKCGVPVKVIDDFAVRLQEKKLRYIVFEYVKGKDLDFEEQFIEKYRNDEGRNISSKKEKLNANCDNCFYNKNRKIIDIANNRREKADTIKIDQWKNEIIVNKNNKKFIACMVKEYIDSLLEEIINEGDMDERR